MFSRDNDWDSTAPSIRDTGELNRIKKKEVKDKMNLIKAKYTAISRFSNETRLTDDSRISIEMSRSSSSVGSQRNSVSRMSFFENNYGKKMIVDKPNRRSTSPNRLKPIPSRFKIAKPILQYSKPKPLVTESFKPIFESQIFTGPPVYGPAKQVYGLDRVRPIEDLSDILLPKKEHTYFSGGMESANPVFWTQTSRQFKRTKTEFDDRISAKSLSFDENDDDQKVEKKTKKKKKKKKVQNQTPVFTVESAPINMASTQEAEKKAIEDAKRKKKQHICIAVWLVTFIILAIVIGVVVALLLPKPAVETTTKFSITNFTNITNITNIATITTITTTSLPTTYTTINCIISSTTKQSQTNIISNSFGCRQIDPYIPSFLTLSNSFYYGYPIYQQVVCFFMQTTKFSLICPPNLYIHVLSGYYGIQSLTSTSCVTDTKSIPTMCYNQIVFGLINQTCEYQNNCSLLVSSNTLGDPCLGFKKQVFIQYQCVDLITLNTINQCPFVSSNITRNCPIPSDTNNTKINIFCEPTILNLQCPSPYVIKIICAFYGIDSATRCHGGYYDGAPSSCYSDSSQKSIINSCDGKRSCIMNGNPDFSMSGFIDPCYGFTKAMYVQWQCVLNVSSTTVYASTATSNSLPFCPNNVKPNGSCPKITSPYKPQFLNSSQTFSFGYPIYQISICSGGKVNILCFADTVIHILAAYFGVQSETLLPTCFSGSGEFPKECYYTKGFDYINSTCENNQTCSFDANIVNLGDACPIVQKQLIIQYQCVEQYALSSTISNCTQNPSTPLICPALTDYFFKANQQVWCDDETLNITCFDNKSIKILCAFYGFHPIVKECGFGSLQSIPVCYYQSSFQIVSNLCDNLTNCTFDSFPSQFRYSCGITDVPNALFVQWKCY